MSSEKQLCPKCKTTIILDSSFCMKCGTNLNNSQDSSSTDETSVIDFDITSKKIIGDRYEIIKEIGKGAMGIVYKAWDQKLERYIALKAIKFNQKVPTRIADIRKRMISEAKAAAKLKHPNIVTIYDVGEEDLNSYIAMEFIDGASLANIINSDKKSDLYEILNIILQICSAISHAHEHNIIHRDLKPANVMLEKNNHVKITDFGIAKIVEDTNKTISNKGVIVGTPSYMSPERFKGTQDDFRSDIFAIGIMIYELFTGVKPFKGSSLTELMHNIIHSEYLPVQKSTPDLPDLVEEIISKAIAKDPEKRYQHVKLLEDSLKQVKENLNCSNDTRKTRTSISSVRLMKENIWNIPLDRNHKFIGRQNLINLVHNNLNPIESAPKIVVLHGLSGIGKTQIALEYAYQYKNDYKIVWWLRAGESSILTADFEDLALKLGLIEKQTDNKEFGMKAVKHWFERNPRWLLIFDNATSKLNITDYIPQNDNGHIIITSQNPNWRGLAEPIKINNLSDVESVQMISDLTGEKDHNVALKLAVILGFLPMALEQACAYIEETGITINEYLDLFRQYQSELFDEAHSFEKTWNISFKLIEKKSLEGADLLNLCSFLSSDLIPKKLIVNNSKYLPESLKYAVEKPITFNRVVAALRSFSLVEVNSESLIFHRMVQSFARQKLDDEHKKAFLEAAIGMINNAFEFDKDKDTSIWEKCSELLPHALVLLDHCKDVNIENEALGNLLTKTGLFLMEQGMVNDAKLLYEKAITIFENLFGMMHPALSPVINYLGINYWYQRKLDYAKDLFTKALAIDEKHYGPDTPEVARDLNNLGLIYSELRNYKIAEDNLEKALKIVENSFGSMHPKVGDAVNNLGRVYQEEGKLSDAKAFFEKSIKIFENSLGKQHPKTVIPKANLGKVLFELGDTTNSRSLIEEALSINENTFGTNHPQVAFDLYFLALVYIKIGEISKARELLERSELIYVEFMGEDHVYTNEIRKTLSDLDK